MNYKEYLNSVEWLIKKNEFINLYLKNNWKICCSGCLCQEKLRVHHLNYKNIGKEIIEGNNSVGDLIFLCDDCHKDLHKINGKFERKKKPYSSDGKPMVFVRGKWYIV